MPFDAFYSSFYLFVYLFIYFYIYLSVSSETLTFYFYLFIYLFIYLLATPRGTWDLISLTRDLTHGPPAEEAQSPNHRTTRNSLQLFLNELCLFLE